MNLVTPLPQPEEVPVSSRMPWAIELSSGERCVFNGHMSTRGAGERRNYECDINGARVYDVNLKTGTAHLETSSSTGISDAVIERIWL